MPYVALYELFPEVAKRETRVLTVPAGATMPLPPGEYSFIEMFCDERDCDCRRAFFNVFSLPARRMEALIAWGWENAAFYKRWLGADEPDVIEQMQGPILDLGSPISRNAKVLLEFFAKVLLADPKYVERVKKHYALFRTVIDSGKRPKRVLPRPGESVAGSGTEADRDAEVSVSRAATSARSGRRVPSLTLSRQQPEAKQKVGRNDPCPCGSGKRFKHCCLR